MAANPTPVKEDALLLLCVNLVVGCASLEKEVGLKQNTEAAMRADWEAVLKSQAKVREAKSEWAKQVLGVKKADAQSRKVLLHCRARMIPLIGTKYSARWMEAGFQDGTTTAPKTMEGREAAVHALALYFDKNPAHESTDMCATAAICHKAHDALSDGRAGAKRAKLAWSAATVAHRKTVQNLRKRVRSLIQELGMVLESNDPRWKRFGLKLPARIASPERVETVTVVAKGKGRLHVEWSQAARASRFTIQVRGPAAADGAFQDAQTVQDSSLLPNVTLGGFNAGEEIEVQVIASNDAADAAPSPVVRAVVG